MVQGEIAVGVTSADAHDSNDLDDETYPLIEGAARVNIPTSSEWALQLDIDGLATFTDRSDGEDNLQTGFTAGAHFAYRESDQSALGFFGAIGSSNGGDDENANFLLGGIEGQLHANNTTLYGQFGYFNADDETENDVITDAWIFRGVGRYFHTPDQRFQAELTYAAGEENDSTETDIDAWGWGVRYDQRFSGSPLGWAIGYNGMQIEDSDTGGSDEVTEHTAFIAITFLFGHGTTPTLQDNNYRGATWDLPDVARMTAYTIAVVD